MTLRCGVGEWARGRHILSSLSSLVGFFLHVLQLPDSPGLHRSDSHGDLRKGFGMADMQGSHLAFQRHSF